ncbi:MAG TPA: Gfo/Idh/MocA family oxidoreductase [Candidatus Latescibacteria bacterium]|nr:MAG: Glucose--fructose oxidoreductase precursor [Candidatus Latescibacteria bacterium ADurb.Bin168]HPU85921.1 Gfo/Idh/MocA family oxidoreductase [Candidatus Latescibacterota bacterium]
MEKLRVGVIGVGGMGTGHCEGLTKNVEETVLTAVCDIDPNVAKEKAKTYGVKAFTSHKKLIKSGLVDAVTIATPHYFHSPIAVAAFEAGLHVLSEKPIAVTVRAGDEMIAAAKASGLVFGVMFQHRTRPVSQAMKKIVSSGVLGRIYRAMMVETHFRTQGYYDSATWRATWKGEGGGVLLNQAPHGIDIFTWLVGLPKKVKAVTRTWRHRIEVEDEASALLEWENGAVGYYHTSTNESPSSDILEVCGDNGKLVYNHGKASLFLNDPPIQKFSDDAGIMWGNPKVTEQPIELIDRPTGHSAILRNWARAILYGEELIAPGVEGINSLEFINAVIFSGATGKEVELPVPRAAYERWIRAKARTSTFQKHVVEKRETDPQHVGK